MKNVLSKLFIIIGLICLSFAGYLYYERTNPNRVSFAYDAKYAKAYSVKKEKIYPIKISIVKANIALPILPAQIKNGVWDATTVGVSYLTSSPLPGDQGNSILYGHNWTSLLGRLVTVRPGDMIEITFNDKSKRDFEVEYTVTVTPDQTHILEPSKDKRITIYTCTGFLDSHRFVAVGVLKEKVDLSLQVTK